jgi:predicted GNAT family acetyltransferase
MMELPKMFGHRKPTPQQVTYGRFELERDGHVAYLEYILGGGVLELSHTEVPQELRGHGMASLLAHTALEFAREHHLKVDVVCPFAAAYLKDHPEYSDLVLR